MTRTYDSMQEVGFYVTEYAKTISADAIAEVSISIHRSDAINERGSSQLTYVANLTFKAVKTGDTIAVYHRPFDSLEEVCDLFGIDGTEEVWEVLE